jgi:hypothetical protein
MNTWILAVVLYGTLAAACMALFKSLKYNRWHAIRAVISAGIIGVLAINGIAMLTTDDYKTPGISRADIARTAGLEANKPYPALTFNGDLAEPHFTLVGFADTKDGRVLNVDFVSDGTTHPLALPANKVILQQDRKLPAQIAIVISNDTVKAYGKKRLVEPDPCRVQFAGITTCQHSPRFLTDPRGDLLLGDVLHDGVERVVIRISPVDYSRLL